MGNVTRVPLYTFIGRHYDDLVREQARLWSRVRRRLLRPILPRVRAVCDLACGSGTTALEFARRGLRVVAVDHLPIFCRLVRRKARRERLPVRVLCADMRRFRLGRPVELITCEFDALNHLPRKSDLGRVVQAVAQALGPGGYFYFDANHRRTFEELWSGMLWLERPGFTLVGRGGYDRRRRKGRAEFDWLLPTGKRWRRYREVLEEVWWTRGEIRRALRRAGFREVRVWDAAGLVPGSRFARPGSRSFWLARKAPARRGWPQPAKEAGRGNRPCV